MHRDALKCGLDTPVCMTPHAWHAARLSVISTVKPGVACGAGGETASQCARVSRAIGVRGAAEWVARPSVEGLIPAVQQSGGFSRG